MKTPKLVATLTLALTPVVAQAIDLPQNYVLTTELAETIAKQALEECHKSEIAVSVSVVNDQGRLVYFFRGQDTGANTVQTSFRNAYTSASLKIPTSALSTAPQADGFSQLGKMDEDIPLLTAGLPLYHQDVLVGARGLSGAPSPDVEEACGITAIETAMGS